MSVGAAVQGAVGFGSNLVAAPLLVLLDTRFVPAPLIVMSLVLNALTGRRETAVVDRRELLPALAGLVPGTALGVVLLRTTDESSLSVLFAVTVLLAMALVASGLHLRPTVATLSVAGLLSGVMGTTSSIGGPPVAVVHSRSEGPVIRATLARFFFAAGLIAVAALAVGGELVGEDLLLAAVLVPGTVAGFAVSGRAARWLDEGRTRAAILVLCTLSAIAVVLREL